MKNLTIIFLLLISTQISTAQFVSRDRKVISQPAKVIICFSGSIITGALSDAMRDEGRKPLSHLYQAASISFMLPLPYFYKVEPGSFGWYLASYCCIRFGLFDLIYNSARGLPLGYVGRTSVYDNTIRKFDPPESMLMCGRALVLSVGIKIPIDHL